MQTIEQSQTQSTNISLSFVMSKVFGWMFLGLSFTAIIAYLVASTEVLRSIVLSNPYVLFGLIIIELILVIVLASQIAKLQSGTALALFFLYSILNGATL